MPGVKQVQQRQWYKKEDHLSSISIFFFIITSFSFTTRDRLRKRRKTEVPGSKFFTFSSHPHSCVMKNIMLHLMLIQSILVTLGLSAPLIPSQQQQQHHLSMHQHHSSSFPSHSPTGVRFLASSSIFHSQPFASSAVTLIPITFSLFDTNEHHQTDSGREGLK